MNNNKNFIIMARFPLTGIYNTFYAEIKSVSYRMYLLGQLLSHLRIEYKTYEDVVYALQNKTSIGGAGDLEYYYGIFNSKTNALEINASYPDFMDQKYFESLYPEEKDKDFLEYTYSISLDNFLELTKKMIDFFNENIELIIIYEDADGKVHLKKFDLENKQMIDNK
jgi:hypothetical protein